MGRPPSNGGPSFRFNPAEIAEMEAILQAHKTQMPAREVLVALAEKFSNSEERKGKIEVQMKQVWNWFQNRRYAIRAKAGKSPGKLINITQVNRDDNPTMAKGIPQPTLPHAASAATVRFMPQAQQHPTVPTVRTFPQAPQNTMSFSVQNAGRVTDNSQMEYEAKSARDGAWYDVSTFLSHRSLDSGDPEVMVRFAGFGAEEDEWVNVRKNVRQRSLPCEASECVAVLPADLILCFQEGKEQALYFDAHVLDAQRRRHDVRGCRCRFLVRYDHDQSEEIVALRKICRRPETDYRLQQLHAVNESKNGGNSIHTVSTLRVYPPAEVQPKQAAVAVAVVPPAEAPLKRQKVEAAVAQPGDVPLDQQSVQPAVPQDQQKVEQPVLPAPSLEPQKVETSPPVAASEPPHEWKSEAAQPQEEAMVCSSSVEVQAELPEVQPASAIESKAEVQTELPKVQPEAVETKAELSEVQQASEMEALETKDEVPLELPQVQPANTVEMKAEVQTELPQVQAADAIESKDEVQMELPQVQPEVVETKAEVPPELPQVQPPNAIETLESKTEVPPELPKVQSPNVVEMKAELPQVQPEAVDTIAEVQTELPQVQPPSAIETLETKTEVPPELPKVQSPSVVEMKAEVQTDLPEIQPATALETVDMIAEVPTDAGQVQSASASVPEAIENKVELPESESKDEVQSELPQVPPATAVMETEVEVPAELPQVQQPTELMETEAEQPKVSEMMETDNRVTTDMEQV